MDEKAFTLIEILIVLFALGIIAMPLANYFSSNIQYSNKMLKRTEMINIAREEIEKEKNKDFENIKSENINDDYNIVKEVDKEKIKDCKLLTVTVSKNSLAFNVKLSKVFTREVDNND